MYSEHAALQGLDKTMDVYRRRRSAAMRVPYFTVHVDMIRLYLGSIDVKIDKTTAAVVLKLQRG